MSGLSPQLSSTDVPAIAAPSTLLELAPARRRWSRASLRVGIVLLGIVVLSGIVVRVFHLGAPDRQDLAAILQAPSLAHPFGTDNLGRDVFIRTLYATVTDLQVGLIATYVPLVIGLGLGVVAGYYGSWVDTIIMRLSDFVLAFPFMVIVIAIVAVFDGGMTGVYVGFILKGWPAYARLTRAEMLVLREQQFILAAQTLGFANRRIIGRHALPHVVRPNLVYSLSDMLTNIVFLASLSYLGLGVQPPTPEWGNIIADGQPYILDAWWISTLPGVVMVIFGLGLSLTGEGLAERLRQRLGSLR